MAGNKAGGVLLAAGAVAAVAIAAKFMGGSGGGKPIGSGKYRLQGKFSVDLQSNQRDVKVGNMAGPAAAISWKGSFKNIDSFPLKGSVTLDIFGGPAAKRTTVNQDVTPAFTAEAGETVNVELQAIVTQDDVPGEAVGVVTLSRLGDQLEILDSLKSGVLAVIGDHGTTLADPPILVAPANNVGFKPGDTIQLTWASVYQASFYEVQIDNTTPAQLQDTSLAVPSVGLNVGSHSWRVRAKLAGGAYTDWSALRVFTMSQAPARLTAPAIVTANGAVFQTNQPVLLIWKPVSGADSYDVGLDTNPNLISVQDTQYNVPLVLLTPGMHTWRVRSVSRNGPSAWSAWQQINIGAVSAPNPGGTDPNLDALYGQLPRTPHPDGSFPSPTLQSPPDQDVFGKEVDTIGFIWSAVPGAVRYDLTIDDQTMNVGPGTSMVLPAIQFPLGDHTWQVRGIDPTVTPGPYSAARTFRVIPAY